MRKEALDNSAKYLLIISVFLLVFNLACFTLRNDDFFHYLRTGQYILETKTIPHKDIFSHTASNRPWINHGWLSGVTFYSLHHLAGLKSLILLKAFIATLAFFILFRIMRHRGVNIYPDRAPFKGLQPSEASNGVYLALGVILLAAFVVYPRLRLRPLIFSFLFLSLFYYILHSFQYRKRNLLFFLPLLMIPWANLHAGFLAGFIILFIFCFAESTKLGMKKYFNRDWGSILSGKELRLLFIITFLVILTSLVNVYGYQALSYSFQLTGKEIFMERVSEWRPIDFSKIFYPYWIMFGLTILALILSRRKIDFTDLVLFLVASCLSLSSRRHIELFVIFTSPILAKHLDIIFKKRMTFRPKTWLFPASLTILILIVTWTAIHLPSQLRIKERLFPDKAVNFIEKNNLSGNLFNPSGWGGYLIWKSYPECKVFIDGRCLVYGERIYEEYGAIFRGESAWENLLDRYRVNLVLIDYSGKHSRPNLRDRLWEDRDWRLIYWDDNTLLYIKNLPQNQALIHRFGYHFLNPDGERIDVEKIEQVIKELKRKLIEDPSSFLAHHLLGMTYGEEGELDLAIEEFQEALKLGPDDATIHSNLAVAYFKKGLFVLAIPEFRKALSLNPDSAEIHFNLARSYLEANMPKEAKIEFKKALSKRETR
ncbi:tetratricopeptide repeat protein [bacterium]|nr:tetratricopeptide repeat protein [bacterium]MCG2678216.1 tetratricopeptide repeat protein [bacterium]